jgi:hypothetical protein
MNEEGWDICDRMRLDVVSAKQIVNKRRDKETHSSRYPASNTSRPQSAFVLWWDQKSVHSIYIEGVFAHQKVM